MRSLSFLLFAVLLGYGRGQTESIGDVCTTGTGTTGVCMLALKCTAIGGTFRGFCAMYMSVCCETNLRCNQSSKLKQTIVKNTALPSGSSTCRYTIEPHSADVCQLLVEFKQFELQQPILDASQGRLVCRDYLEIGKYQLCGTMSQQHLYFHLDGDAKQFSMQFNLPDRSLQSSWHLVVSQLECPQDRHRESRPSIIPFVLRPPQPLSTSQQRDLATLAPSGCDQYFTEKSGIIRSFNFNGSSFYLPQLNYVICVKSNRRSTIEYRLRKFAISVQNADTNYDQDCHSTIETAGRRADYLTIPQSVVGSSPTTHPVYYCGTFLPNEIIYAKAPFFLNFVSDNVSDESETGFDIAYTVK